MSQARLAASRSAGSLRRGSKVLALTGFLALLLSLVWMESSNAAESPAVVSVTTYATSSPQAHLAYAYDALVPIGGVERLSTGSRGQSSTTNDTRLVPVVRSTGTTTAAAQVRADAGAVPAAKNACKIGNSFDHDTPVLMADGSLKPIAEVELGDYVWATDPLTGEQGPRAVVDLIRHTGLHTMVAIKLADGTTIDATDGHPFWVAGRAPPGEAGSSGAWVEAIHLAVGDGLRAADGQRVEVVGLTISIEDLTAYNLTVAGLHTYYAGDEPVLVHNSGCFDGDQRALISLAKAAKKRGGVSHSEGDTLAKWAKEYGLPGHGPARHPGRPGFGGTTVHINIGPIKHIRVR